MPRLWNAFEEDVGFPTQCLDGQENLFVDDLTIFQKFDRHLSVDQTKSKMDESRKNAHKWETISRISFEPAKQHVVILHPSVVHDDNFKLLDCMIDPDLRMHSCIDQFLLKKRPKITAILRIGG